LDVLQKLPPHQNVIEFYGALQTENCVWIITEFIARGDLRF